MQKFLHILSFWLLVLLIGMSTAACSSDNSADAADDAVTEYAEGLTFRIRIAVDNGERATRAAGPSSEDGYFAANENEYTVYNATLLFYQSEDGVNASADTKILFGVFAPQFVKSATSTADSPVYECTPAVRVGKPIPVGQYHILVICNRGNYTDYVGKTLGEVRDLQIDNAYLQTGDLTTASYFVLTSQEDHKEEIVNSSENNPQDISLKVERLAARIDFSPGAGEWTGTTTVNGTTANYYMYKVVDSDGNETNDRFYLSAVTPFNLLNSGEYLFKRVTQPAYLNRTNYLGKELTNTSKEGTNYVLDPWTRSKTTATSSGNSSTTTSGTPELNYLYPYADLQAAAPNLVEIKGDHSADVLEYQADNLKYRVLTYTMENTILTSSNKAKYATGLRFTGIYAKALSGGGYAYTQRTYDYYIRHTDPNNSNLDALIMKYGIVRNHIYRVSVNKVSSLGIIVLEVKNWIPVTVPDIYM